MQNKETNAKGEVLFHNIDPDNIPGKTTYHTPLSLLWMIRQYLYDKYQSEETKRERRIVINSVFNQLFGFPDCYEYLKEDNEKSEGGDEDHR